MTSAQVEAALDEFPRVEEAALRQLAHRQAAFWRAVSAAIDEAGGLSLALGLLKTLEFHGAALVRAQGRATLGRMRRLACAMVEFREALERLEGEGLGQESAPR